MSILLGLLTYKKCLFEQKVTEKQLNRIAAHSSVASEAIGIKVKRFVVMRCHESVVLQEIIVQKQQRLKQLMELTTSDHP